MMRMVAPCLKVLPCHCYSKSFSNTLDQLLNALLGGAKDHVNVSYKGVPTNGQSCKQAYKLPANQMKCIQQDGRGGK